jgi:hypothetical protein
MSVSAAKALAVPDSMFNDKDALSPKFVPPFI